MQLRALILCLIATLTIGCQEEKKPAFVPEEHDVSLTLAIENGTEKSASLAEIHKLQSLPSLSHQDHLFGEEKRYVGLNVAHLRQLAGADEQQKVLKLHCRDGFVSEVDIEVLEQGQFLLAFRDIDAAPKTFLDYSQMSYLQSEPKRLKEELKKLTEGTPEYDSLKRELDHTKTLHRDMKSLRNQGPFYPIFIASDSLPKEKRWSPPFCVDKVTFAETKTDKSKALPKGLADEHPAMRGATAFQKKCSSCHAINGIGGQVGPELNYPMSVTEYWQEEGLRQMMKDPRKVRANSKMPAFHLKDEVIDEILAYLKWMAKSREG